MVTINNADLADRVAQDKLVAILRGTDVDATVAAASVLLEAGVRTLEVALTLPGAEEAIAQIVSFAPEGSLVGAGTVLTPADVDRSVEAGAQFMVTPVMSASVAFAAQHDIGVLPGVYTPTEIYEAMELGVAAAKVFPASALGPGFIKAVRDPLPNARLIPVGGVDLDIIPKYLAVGAVAVGVGGPLVGNAAQPGGDLDGLRERAAAFVSAVR